tara:strand:- start:4008 stop:5303 length:1296 start_codon:yes stop_codon:yes gene_type:complete
MGGKGSAPAAPDYLGAATAQAQASERATTAQNYANRPSINTPFGGQSWTTGQSTDPATGQAVTSWTQNTSLAPGLQNALDSQIGLQNDRSQLASGFMDRVAGEYAQPFDYANLPRMAQVNAPASLGTSMADYSRGLSTGFNFGAPLPQVDSGYRDTVANQLMQRMQPVHDYQQSQLETRLANQGFTVGSEGYKRGLDELGQRQSAERFNALDQSGNEMQRLFGMQMQTANTGFNQNLQGAQFGNQALGQAAALDQSRMGAQNAAMGQQQNLNQSFADQQNRLRQQAIAEQMQRRGMSLNEMNALLSGQQVQMPNMPSFNPSGRAETPNLLGATQMGYDAQLGNYNAQQAGFGNLLGAGAQLGSAFLFSDRRLKSNIKRVGTHPALGVGIYTYKMMGMPQHGVIAQEVRAVRPDLVRRHASGYLQVNYGGLA